MILNTLDSSVCLLNYDIEPDAKEQQCSLLLSDSVQSPRVDRNQRKLLHNRDTKGYVING